MNTNLGGLDRLLRVILGLGLISLMFVVESNARWFGVIGLVPLLTGLMGYCPLYAILGFSSCPLQRREAWLYFGLFCYFGFIFRRIGFIGEPTKPSLR
jgi:hypothetical protein